ncbi:MAG: glucose-1-phosphate thymidylyltransferase [Saprospiraceae bacterium]|nr:glucose-1-phosphate thymidylyltransferase [Saprospiraceae bacterium]
MKVILFDGPEWGDLLPLTFTRPVADIRIGIDTIREKWEAALHTSCEILTQPYLQQHRIDESGGDYLMINAAYIPDAGLAEALIDLPVNRRLTLGDNIVAWRTDDYRLPMPEVNRLDAVVFPFSDTVIHIAFPWNIFSFNHEVLKSDFARITLNRTSKTISSTNRIIGDDVFAEEGVVAEGAIINSTLGPVYLGRGSEIMEGAMIRGGLALCEGSSIKMGAKLYGANTFGPHCKIGGEVTNSIFQGYSNKGHDGYLGNSVIGCWCNFGADTNSSNLKNNYKKISIYNYPARDKISSGQQFLGLIMGDHSKTGINTMLNTGTVVGVFANIFGSGFPDTHIPSFTWCDSGKMEPYRFEKAIEVAQNVMARRNLELSETEKGILAHIFRNPFLS